MKYAGIDIGEAYLMAVFVDDESTRSLLVDGKPFKDYNKMVNKVIEQLKEIKSKEVLEWGISKAGRKYPVKYTDKAREIDKLISFLNLERDRFFHDQIYKMAKYVIKYLRFYGVTNLCISERLANHKFIKIKFEKLLEQIRHEAHEHGISVEPIDESFTSRVSCISGNIKIVQKNNDSTDEACKGKLNHNRRLFIDNVINKKFNADLNAAVNHIKVGTNKNFEWLKDKLFKLNEPIKIKSDQDFEKLLANLKKSSASKPDGISTKNK